MSGNYFKLGRNTVTENCPNFNSLHVQTIQRFCELFLGTQNLAEEVTIELFRSFQPNPVGTNEGTPVHLLAKAFANCQQLPSAITTSDLLHTGILRLPSVERAIFILHAALSIQMPWVAAIVGLSHDDALRQWAHSLIQLREFLLPTGYLKERSK